ncbi:MAG: C-terminal binding protein, partial [Verrucomicrobiota bacterium]
MPDLPRVVVTDFMTEPLTFERRVLDGVASVEALNAFSEEELVGKVENADAIMVYHYFRLTRATIERLEKCRIIVRPGVGYDGVELEAAKECGIPVCNVPDYGTEEVADSTLAMALSLVRGTHVLNSRLRREQGEWSVDEVRPLPRVRGRVFGIIGCGRIGSAVALRAKAFGFDVLFFDPYLPDGIEKSLGVRRADSLMQLLSSSYVLSIHCPLTPETRGMIGCEEIASMTRGGHLINTARGGIVDTEAVVDALHDGILAGAGIDVLETEPPPADSSVLRAWRDSDHPAHDRLLLNPHAAFHCEEGAEEF